tara:strand:- start:361 stop:798 length:438 start_codon:yes stop_codon:yes gene_type:complete
MTPVKFTEEVREAYLSSIRSGNMRNESARIAGISYRTVERRRKNDPEFASDELRAFDEANEGVEKVLRDMALQGDISAIKMWLASHKRSTYGQKTQVQIDATDNAVQLGQAGALGKIADLQASLSARRLELESEDGVLDVASEEV